MKKKFSLLLLMMFFMMLVVACSSNEDDAQAIEEDSSNNDVEASEEQDSDEVITLKFATSAPADSPFSDMLYKPFIDKVEEYTEGKVKIDWYPGEQLGKGSDYLYLVRDGVADIAYLAPVTFSSELPLSYNLALPGLYNEEDIILASEALYNTQLQSPVIDEFLNHDVRPVSSLWAPGGEIWVMEDIELGDIENVKDLKISNSGGIIAEILTKLEANPVQMNPADAYSALDTGVVDGIAVYAGSVRSFSMQEILKAGTKGAQLPGNVLNLIINESLYQGLPAEIQEAIVKAGKETGLSAAQIQYEDNLEKYNEFSDDGINIQELTDEQTAEWNSFYNEFLDDYATDEQILEAIEIFKKEYENIQ